MAAKKYKATLESAPVLIEAGLAEGDTQGPPQFSALLYSGGRVPGGTATPRMESDYVMNLAGTTRSKSVKANLDHKLTQRVGHVTAVEIGETSMSVAGLLSAATNHRDEVANSAKSGYEWEVSLEAELFKPRRIAAGKTVTVNGQDMSGPLIVFDQVVLTGLAFVSRGADLGNSVKIAASAAGDETMTDFEKYCASLGITDLDTIDDTQRANLQVAFDATKKPAKKASRRPFSEAAADIQAENERIEKIHSVGLAAIREFPMYADQINDAVESAEQSRLSADQFELQLLRTTRTMAGAINSRLSTPRHDAKVVEAALAMSACVPDLEKHYSAATLEAVDSSGMRGFGIQQLLIQTAIQNGYNCRHGERIHVGNLRSVLEYCFPPVYARLSGGTSTISLPGILGNVANKMILAGFMEEDTTWKEIAEVKNATNFYQQTHYRMLDDLEYEEIAPGGEIPHGRLGQESYTSQLKTYAKMLGLNHEQIINDDLGAFDDLRTRLGRGAALRFNNKFWAAFMDNASFFTTALGNYLEGVSYALAADGVGLQGGITTYRKLRSPVADGQKRVGTVTSPSILVAPPELEFVADRLYQSTHVNTGGAATAESVGNANIHAGKYKPVIQNRLSDTGFTGNSAKAWYLFGKQLKPMIVTFLNGQQVPTVQSADADFNQLGIQFRGVHYFGCDKAEQLSGVKVKGEN